jgi:hypothetical protein
MREFQFAAAMQSRTPGQGEQQGPRCAPRHQEHHCDAMLWVKTRGSDHSESACDLTPWPQYAEASRSPVSNTAQRCCPLTSTVLTLSHRSLVQAIAWPQRHLYGVPLPINLIPPAEGSDPSPGSVSNGPCPDPLEPSQRVLEAQITQPGHRLAVLSLCVPSSPFFPLRTVNSRTEASSLPDELVCHGRLRSSLS